MTDREDTFQRIVAEGAFNGQSYPKNPVLQTVITLPWPSPTLSPNGRVHWARKAKATKSARTASFILTRNAIRTKPAWAAVSLSMVFCPPDRRRRDADNILSSCKSKIDGIADALGIDDSKFVVTYAMGKPINGGSVVVTISEARDA